MLETRIPPPVYALVTGLAMWYVDRALPLLRLVQPPWNRVGWGLVAVGFFVAVAAASTFVKARTTLNPHHVANATTLVDTGIFCLSRNPMYLGLLLALAGLGVLLGSLAPLILVFVFERVIVLAQIRPEERALEAKFGDAYREYCRRVRRWFGRRAG